MHARAHSHTQMGLGTCVRESACTQQHMRVLHPKPLRMPCGLSSWRATCHWEWWSPWGFYAGVLLARAAWVLFHAPWISLAAASHAHTRKAHCQASSGSSGSRRGGGKGTCPGCVRGVEVCRCRCGHGLECGVAYCAGPQGVLGTNHRVFSEQPPFVHQTWASKGWDKIG